MTRALLWKSWRDYRFVLALLGGSSLLVALAPLPSSLEPFHALFVFASILVVPAIVAWRTVTADGPASAILATLPRTGSLCPYLQTVEPGHRATEFRQRCLGLGIKGVTLHSYRYAWAERAKVVGYPERFAQLALGHNSKAVHRAYSKNAKVTLPPLEDYEKNAAAAQIIPLSLPVAG